MRNRKFVKLILKETLLELEEEINKYIEEDQRWDLIAIDNDHGFHRAWLQHEAD